MKKRTKTSRGQATTFAVACALHDTRGRDEQLTTKRLKGDYGLSDYDVRVYRTLCVDELGVTARPAKG